LHVAGARSRRPLRERAHRQRREHRQHFLENVGTDAGLCRGLRRDLAADVLAAEQVPEDAVAIPNGVLLPERGRLVEILRAGNVGSHFVGAIVAWYATTFQAPPRRT
jgi:hypothetical protein